MARALRLAAIVLSVIAWSIQLRAEDKPAENAEPPRIVMSIPLALPSGKATKIVLRGWKLDQASDLKLSLDGATAKIVNKGDAPVPNGQEAKQIGDQRVEVELTIPENPTANKCELQVVTPAGTSEAYTVPVLGSADLFEQEPNDGFTQALHCELPCLLIGQIQNDRDVDVVEFTAEAGKTVRAVVAARTAGSALDSLLTLYDAEGNIVGSNDDADSVDSQLELKVPRAGVYRLVLQDANDHGGPAHPYRLQISLQP